MTLDPGGLRLGPCAASDDGVPIQTQLVRQIFVASFFPAPRSQTLPRTKGVDSAAQEHELAPEYLIGTYTVGQISTTHLFAVTYSDPTLLTWRGGRAGWGFAQRSGCLQMEDRARRALSLPNGAKKLRRDDSSVYRSISTFICSAMEPGELCIL